jgi:hypothetical protein
MVSSKPLRLNLPTEPSIITLIVTPQDAVTLELSHALKGLSQPCIAEYE